jgi:hypothetical protein
MEGGEGETQVVADPKNNKKKTLSPRHGSSPVVSECDGDYHFDKRGPLVWQLPVIDAGNKSGSIEFSCGGCPDDFFPVHVTFYAKKTYSGIQVKPISRCS